MHDHRNATPEAMAWVRDIASGEDRPVLMLNLNRYADAAGFPDGDPYSTYMARLNHTVHASGGAVLWRAPVEGHVIGCDHDAYHEILAVWYPNHAALPRPGPRERRAPDVPEPQGLRPTRNHPRPVR